VIRRNFLKAGGALVVGFNLRDTLGAQEQPARGTKPGPPDAKQVDTWLAIHADNTATVYIGFAELGQGASTALLQIAAEELDLDMSQLKTVRLDTNVTPNQGGTYSSASINRGGPQVRTAAAEARLALLKLASAKLNAPVEGLVVSKGVVSGTGNPKDSVTYGELVGDKPFNVTFTGTASVKPTTAYKIVGTKFPRNDTPAKVSAQYTYMQYVRVPGMLHGRVVRPRGQRMYGAGAKIVSVDEASIRTIPGARVVRKGDFLGVVAENEWDAIRAAQQLKVVWETPPALPGNAGLYEQMRAAKTEENIVLERGSVATGFGGAAHTVSQTCLGPYQAHAPFGPNCAVADVQADSALVMCSTHDVYGTRYSLSRLLGMPEGHIVIADRWARR
jgi:nicotinate dehydrogenase subunit B